MIGPTIIPSHGKTCPRVVEIVKSEHVTAFAADIKQKWKRFTHSQNNMFYADTLFLHRGYEHSTRIFSLAKKLVERTMIYTYVYSNLSYKTEIFPKPPFSDHAVSFANWTAPEKLPARENFKELGIDWHFAALCSLLLS